MEISVIAAMDNKVDLIRAEFENLKKTVGIMVPLVEFVESSLFHEIDPARSRVIDDDEAMAVEFFPLNKSAAPVLLVFWLENGSRFTFFIENHEVFDKYIENHEDITHAIANVKTILSNEVERLRIVKRGRLVKEVYRYSILENGNMRRHESESRVGWSLPFGRVIRTEHTFSSWL